MKTGTDFKIGDWVKRIGSDNISSDKQTRFRVGEVRKIIGFIVNMPIVAGFDGGNSPNFLVKVPPPSKLHEVLK